MVKCRISQRGYNMNLIDKILEEWAYRVHDGMPNPKNPLHMIHLEETLNELKLPRKVSEKLLQNLRQIKEIDIVKNKESGNVYDVQKHNPDTQDLVKKDASEKDIEKVKKDKDEPEKEPTSSEFVNSAYGKKRGKIQKDEGSDWEIKQKGLNHGYHTIKDENGKTIFKPAPGNAGSMWNEIISGETAKILEKYPNFSDEELTKIIINQFGKTKLAEDNQSKEVTSGLGIKNSDVPEGFNKGLWSKTLNTVKAGRRKNSKALESAKALGIENPKINHFYGHKDSFIAMKDGIDGMPTESKIYSYDAAT